MTSTIGVLGCGWLGLPLAKNLLAAGIKVKGTTTSDSKLKLLDDEGINAFNIQFNEDCIIGDIESFLSNLDCLVINIPPGLRRKNTGNYFSKMKLLQKELEKVALIKLVFISSTSVYGNIEGEITEEAIPKPVTESGKQLLQSEKLFLENTALNTAIIRFGGLIGNNRHPIKHLAGKEGLKNGDELINLIHLNDCIHMISTVIKNNYWNTIFNGVYPLHPLKREYYTAEAIKRGLPLPKFESSKSKTVKKTVKNQSFLNKNQSLYTSIIS